MDNQNKLDYNDFAGKFGQWGDLFRPFIESKEMYEIYRTLKRDAETEIIVPKSDDTFRSIASVSPGELKTIWYMMDPYPRRYRNKAFQATGIAMDCSNTPDGKLQPSLEKFYEGIDNDLRITVQRSPDLSYLSDQGVILTNTDLTCKLNKTGSHEGLWDPFHKFFLEEVMSQFKDIVYVLSGKSSHRMEKYIYPIGNYVFKIDHPVSASYTDTLWNHKNIFSKINSILKEHKKEEIMWNKTDYDKYYQPPF